MRRLATRHPGRVAVGLDARGRDVAVRGWVESSGRDVVDVARSFEDAGVAALVVTEIGVDGTLAGPALDQLSAVLEATTVDVVASGGVGTLDDLRALDGLDVGGRRLAGAIVGRALYEGAFALATACRCGGVLAMKSVRIIPCLDVTDGRVVKGVNFVGLRDAGDPVELAARYDQEGADELIFLDITASSDARETMVDVARRTAEQVFIPFTIGGGIRSVDDARRLLRAGADKVSINTAAVERPGSDHRAVRRVRRPVRGGGDRRPPRHLAPRGRRRRPGRPQRVPGVHPRRAHADHARRGGVGGGGRAAGRGRDPAHLDGPRRHQGRLRPGAHQRHRPTP